MGEWIGTLVILVGFFVSLILVIFLGNHSDLLSDFLDLPFLRSGVAGILLMPVYGFLIMVFTRFLAEQFRALASIANNTRKLRGYETKFDDSNKTHTDYSKVIDQDYKEMSQPIQTEHGKLESNSEIRNAMDNLLNRLKENFDMINPEILSTLSLHNLAKLEKYLSIIGNSGIIVLFNNTLLFIDEKRWNEIVAAGADKKYSIVYWSVM